MKKLALAAIIGLLPMILAAQSERSAFTTTGRGVATTFVQDYHALGINASNRGWNAEYEGKIVTFGLAEVAYSMHSGALSKPDFRESLLEFGEGTLSYEDKVAAAKSFAGSDLSWNLDLMAVGIAANTPAGGFGISVRDRIQYYSSFNETVSDIMFRGFNADYFDVKLDQSNLPTLNPDSVVFGQATVPNMISEVLEGTRMSLNWYREYNLSYGKKIMGEDDSFSLYGGLGLKYVQGILIADAKVEDGKMESFAAYNLDWFDEDTTGTKGGLTLPSSAAGGFGFDIGFSAIIKGKLKVGLALNDVGSLTWENGTVLEVSDTLIVDTKDEGLNSYNVLSNLGKLLGEEGMFKWDSVASRKVQLPSNVRVGASYKVGEKLEVGVDFVIPVNTVSGSYGDLIYGLGGTWSPAKAIKLSAGMQGGGNYDIKIPLGITFVIAGGSWEVGIASRDAITFISQNSPTISMSTGFLRFRV